MPDGGNPPPLDKRPRRGRTGIPRAVVRRNIFDQSVVPVPPPITTTHHQQQQPQQEPNPAASTTSTTTATTSTSSSTSSDVDSDDDAPDTIATGVAVPTPGSELVKRSRPCTSSSGSDAQEDKRLKLGLYSFLPPPGQLAGPFRSSPRPMRSPPPPPSIPTSRHIATSRHSASPQLLSLSHVSAAEIALSHSRDAPRPLRAAPQPPAPATPYLAAISPRRLPTAQRSHDSVQARPPSRTLSPPVEHGDSPSWPTSYAGLASPSSRDVPMDVSRPHSPQPSTSYAMAAAAPASPRRAAPTAAPRTAPAGNTVAAPAATDSRVPRSSYPPLVVECLPNWTRHFEALRRTLGHAPNARPLGRGVRFLPKSAEEFRAVQRHLTQAASQDPSVSWYCYSPATEIPVKIAIRGLPLETPAEEVVAALRTLGFPAEAARAIPPPRGKHGCTFFVRLTHMPQEELGELYKVTELLHMPQVSVEAWRGGNKPPQCHRCQVYGHNSINCFRAPKCVRCSGPHLVRDCRPDEPVKCANCGRAHAANDRRCHHYKREARRRGIKIPPPPPRSRQPRPRKVATATAAPAPPAPGQGEQRPEATVPPAAAPLPAHVPHAATEAATVAASAREPTTLAAPANLPTGRGEALPKKKRRRNRAPRPARSEPMAASTPQPRQTRGEGSTAALPQPTAGAFTAPAAPAQQARPGRPAARQHTTSAYTNPPMPPATPLQGEVPTHPDIMGIIRVVVEAITTGLNVYLQGQGAIPAVVAGLAVLKRLGQPPTPVG